VISENLGYFTYCAPVTYPGRFNPCAEGRVAWMLERTRLVLRLADGGTESCVPEGAVCVYASDCVRA